ncbi:RHS repeat-associated core domain-containing protein [Pokkaliibacter sp. CJK22405]|uniref:RHS repeat-associated core domain-containing protein n=1 Tax=Pokkaliibacter sp. CJK22405 TaxID=3384615 RepID=UPI0039852818
MSDDSIDWYADDQPPYTAQDVHQQLISGFKNGLSWYREQTEDRFYSSFLSALRMDQTIAVGDQTVSQDIQDHKAPEIYATCPKNGKLKLLHTFQSSHYIPIPHTPFKIQPVKKVSSFFHDYEDDGAAITGTLDDKGAKELSGLKPDQTYRIIFYPDVSKSDVDAMFASYGQIQTQLTSWLEEQWQGFEPEWQAWCTMTPFERGIALDKNAAAGAVEAMEGLVDDILDMLKTAWDMLKTLWDFLTHPRESIEKVKRLIKTTLEFDWDDVLKLIETANEAVGKALAILQDEAFLFLYANALATWIRMVPPQVLARLAVKLIVGFIIDVVIGVVLTGGLGLAARYGVKAKSLANKTGPALNAVRSLIEKSRSMVGGHLPKSRTLKEFGVGELIPVEKTAIQYPEVFRKTASVGNDLPPPPRASMSSPASHAPSPTDVVKAEPPADIPKAITGGQKEMGWPQQDATVEARKQNHDTRVHADNNQAVHNEPGKTDGNQPAESAKGTCTDGCPVSMVTGEELLTLNDARLEGPLALVWSRMYRTTAVEQQLGMGYGWSHSLNHRLTVAQDRIHWRDHEGRTVSFPHPSLSRPSIINPLAGAALYLGEKPSEAEKAKGILGEIILTQPGLPFYHFRILDNRTLEDGEGATGYLHALSDAYGNRLAIHYDDQMRLSSVQDRDHQWLRFRYQEHKQERPEGLRHLLDDTPTVSLLHEVVLERRVELSDQNPAPRRESFLLIRYHYNALHQLIAAENALGEQERYRYDKHHVIQERLMAGGACFFWEWERQGKFARAIRHGGNITGQDTRYVWNDATGEVTAIYSDGSELVYQHDHNAKLVKQVDPDGATHLKDYNDNGDIVREVDPMGAETRYHYDTNGALEAIEAPDGSTTTYEYSRGQLRRVDRGDKTWIYKRNAQGDIVEKTDPQGGISYYQYTDHGQLSLIQYPDGAQHLLEWNTQGQLIGEVLPEGSTRRYRYDAKGRQILRQDERGAITRFDYDALDQLTCQTLPGGATRQYAYNAYGKVTRFVDEKSQTTHYEYDKPLHLVTRQINPDGSSLRFRYDDHRLFLTDIENEKGEHYRLAYHPSGLVKEEIDFAGRTTRYDYDLNGKLTEKTEVAATLPGDKEPISLTTVFKRDVMGRLVEKVLPDESSIYYHYDSEGNLTQVDDGEWPLFFEYDELGRLTAEHQNAYTQRYGYDGIGRLDRIKLPDGNRLSYHYGAASVLTGIDLNGNPLTRHTYQAGQEISRTQGAVTTGYRYDEQGRLTEQELFHPGSNKALQHRRYGYNALGNLETLEDSRKGIRHYDYDPLDRLTAVRGVVEERFLHDKAGNLIGQQDLTPGYAADQQEGFYSKISGNRIEVQGDRHLEYDGFGNLVSEYRGKGHKLHTRYEYDGQHRLIKATLPDGTVASYRYDAFGRRISKNLNGYTTYFYWQANRLIAETDELYHFRSYLYEPDTYKPLVQLEGRGHEAEVYYYHLDHLGTPQEITAANGNLVWSVQYKAYGNVQRKLIEKIDTPLRFQGQYFDVETGLHYNRHRYYHPGTGHFLTPDPIKLAGGLNNYQYVPNPVNWVDPLGLDSIKDVASTQRCPKKYVPGEVAGRKVYKNTTDINPGIPNEVDPSVDKSIRQKVSDGWSNLDLMEGGYAPIGPDGKQINLHHVLGQEPGPMVELTSSTHKKYHRQLHGLIEDGNSFRRTPTLKYKYDKFRKEYWKERAKDFKDEK